MNIKMMETKNNKDRLFFCFSKIEIMHPIINKYKVIGGYKSVIIVKIFLNPSRVELDTLYSLKIVSEKVIIFIFCKSNVKNETNVVKYISKRVFCS